MVHCITLATIACPAALAENGGTRYVTPENGWRAFEVISINDDPADGFAWAMPGIFDGVGAQRLGFNDLRIQVNHELGSNNGTISEVNLDLAVFQTAILDSIATSTADANGLTNSFDFVNSAQQAYDRFSLDGGATFTATTNTSNTAFNRFCSGQSYVANTFGLGRGFVDDIYITGEEINGGDLFAIDLAHRDFYNVSDNAGGSTAGGMLAGVPSDRWENAALIDTGETNHVALLLSPDVESTDGDLQIYVGQKGLDANGNPSNSFLARNGLAYGNYYYLSDNGPGTDGDSLTVGGPALVGGFDTTVTGSADSDKLEDIDTAPHDPTRVVLNDQTDGTFELDFSLDFSSGSFNAGASSFTMAKVIDEATSGTATSINNQDNVDWTRPTTLGGTTYSDGLWFINEDSTTGQVWMVEPDGSNPTLIASTGAGSNATESSGVLDISELVGFAPGSILLTTNQGDDASLTTLIHPSATIQTVDSAYFSIEGDYATAGGRLGADIELLGDVSAIDEVAIISYGHSGGVNRAGDLVTATSIDSVADLDSAALGFAATNDDGGPGLDPFLTWPGSGQTGGDLGAGPLRAGDYDFTLREFNDNDTGAFAVDIVGPSDRTVLKSLANVGGGTIVIDSLKFGTDGAANDGFGNSQAAVFAPTLNLTLTGDLVVAETGSARLELAGPTIGVAGDTTVKAGGRVEISSGLLQTSGNTFLNAGTIEVNGGAFDNLGNFTAANGFGQVGVNAGVMDVDGTLTLDGSNILIQGGTVNANGDVSLDASIINQSSGDFTFSGASFNASNFSVLTITGDFDAGNNSTWVFDTQSQVSTTLDFDIGSGSNADITVRNPGSSFTSSSGMMSIGFSGGTGSLTLEDQASGTIGGFLNIALGSDTGSLTVQSDADLTLNASANVGADADSNGAFTVTGPGSSVTQSGAVGLTLGSSTAGATGSGTLAISNSAIFTTGTGAINVNATGVIDVDSAIFRANGDVTFEGGVLDVDAPGEFDLGAGRSVLAQNNAVVSLAGPYAIDEGTTFNIESGSSLVTTQLFVGSNGTGVLNINGGTHTALGLVDVTGGILNRLSTTGFDLAPGQTLRGRNNADINFTGTYSLSGGRTIDLQSGADFDLSVGLDIGNGTTGTVVVDGEGTTLTTQAAPAFWGLFGGAADVTFSNDAAGSIGAGTVELATLGDNSTGTIDVLSGASLLINNLDIADDTFGPTGNTGVVHVSGVSGLPAATPSTITQAGTSTLRIGGADTGNSATLNVGNGANSGGTFNTGTGATTLGNNGNLVINGGVFNANGDFIIDGGLNTTGGKLTRDATGQFNLANGRTFLADDSADIDFAGNYVMSGGTTHTIREGAFMDVTGILAVGFNDAATSTLNIENNGGVYAASFLDTGALTVGTSGATGVVNLSGVFAVLEVDGGTGSDNFIGGGASGGTGTINISGPSGLLQIRPATETTFVETGGTINVNNGGTFQTFDNNVVVRGGTINRFAGGVFNPDRLTIQDGGLANFVDNYSINAGEVVSVNNAGTLQTQNSLFIPAGTLHINGGELDVAGGLVQAFSSGEINITGGYDLAAGATLSIVFGAALNQTGPTDAVRAGVDGFGEIEVNGQGSTATFNLQGDLELGPSGFANLSVVDGGVVTIGGDIYAGADPASTGLSTIGISSPSFEARSLYLGHAAGSSISGGRGDMVVDGVFVTINEQTFVGDTDNGQGQSTYTLNLGVAGHTEQVRVFETGHIQINNNGTLRAFDGLIMRGGSLHRTATGVLFFAENEGLDAGQDAQLNFDGELRIRRGETFQINSGADLVADTLDIGNIDTGSLSIAGDGSTVTHQTSSAFFGRGGGRGEVFISDRGLLDLGTNNLYLGDLNDNSTGVMDVTTGGELRVGPLFLASDAFGAINTSASLTVRGSSFNSNVPSSVIQAGAATLDIGGTGAGSTALLELRDGGEFTSGTGLTTVGATGTLSLESDTTFSGLGSIDFNGGTLALDLFGTGVGSGLAAPSLGFAGTADLTTGVLDLSVAGIGNLSLGDNTVILSANSVVGLFDTVLGADLGNGLSIALLTNPSAVIATVVMTLPGDANNDGVVDLLDFDILAQNFGSTSATSPADADFNGDGAVNLLDFDILAQNFGASSPSQIPEPISLALLVLTAPLFGQRRRRYAAGLGHV
ncbi:MAG: dockerin type I domain-containing protein [Planctomycetota bacterium]